MNTETLEALITHPYTIAEEKDIDFLVELEKQSFDVERQASKKAILGSIRSPHQIVIIRNDGHGLPCASVILRAYKRVLRIMSIAVSNDFRGKGVGKEMLELVESLAMGMDYEKVILEAEATDSKLVKWYESFGFQQYEILDDYYAYERHAVRMAMMTKYNFDYLVVTDYDTDFFDEFNHVKHIRANRYFEDKHYQQKRNLRVINLCNSFKYLSVGYYVSLFALARNQTCYPSASLIRDLDNHKVVRSVGEESHDLIQLYLSEMEASEVVVYSLFGHSSDPALQKLVDSFSNLYQAPLIRFSFIKRKDWILNGIKIISLKDALGLVGNDLYDYAKRYFNQSRFVGSTFKQYQYDLAILVDPNEKLPPSDEKALKAFEKAAEKTGFYVEYIHKKDFSRIPEFDALFIRTTTSVRDYTYDFARYAYAEGLVVMDDPWSIMRCANKIYLYETLRNANIAMPKTWVINKKSNYMDVLTKLTYPIILKLPDSAFSLGVYKVNDIEACKEKLKLMFKESELIVAQDFMPTEYDWRIGVLDRKPLYACKYYMAGGHWQIVDWEKGNETFKEGNFEAVSLDNVPKAVLSNALRATHSLGDGLYGVDLKYIKDKAYVIEVNDNPSIEYQVEDAVEGSDLYMKIMKSFYNRLENNVKVIRNIN